MWKRGRFKTKAWATSIVDTSAGRLLDVARGRTTAVPVRWIMNMPAGWRETIECAVLDLSDSYRVAFDTTVAHARRVADPFHVVKLANSALDDIRRRAHNDVLGHRDRKDDLLCRARKLLVSAPERITDDGRVRLWGVSAGGYRGSDAPRDSDSPTDKTAAPSRRLLCRQ